MERAALSLVVAAVSPIITKLGDKVTSNFGGDITPKELQDLKTFILPKIRTVIDTAGKIDAMTLRPWLMELKATAYEAEDILDMYQYEKIKNEVSPLPASLKKIKSKSKELFAPALLKTRLKRSLEKLQQSANEADKLISLLQLVCMTSSTQQDNNIVRQKQHTTVSGLSSPVFGRDEECNSLVNMLITEAYDQSSGKQDNVPVHAIYGLGGAGKTTLAQYICKDTRIENHFDLKIWVHVSRTFDTYRITKEIIESVLKGESSPSGSLDVLQKKLMEVLKSKRFLLVLDDVWCEEREQWDQMLIPLNEAGEVGSKILITIRTELVALKLGVKNIVSLKELKTEDCWSIVKHYAYGEDIVDPELQHVGEQIVMKLKNSPLAARMVGSSLAQKVSVDEWKMFLKDNNMLKDTMDALYWSFQHLSPTLQRCFAYCSLYPKGYPKGFVFWNVDDLVRLWIAQGFIEAPSTNDMTWEEKGKQCFNDLLINSFFQRNKYDYEYYKIHDLLHDLAEEVSKDDCFRIESEEPVTIPDTIIHLSIATSKLVIPIHDILKLVNLRSFIIHFGVDYENTVIGTKEMFEKLKRLRVLHFGWKSMSELNSCIGQLNHLRYLQVFGVKKLSKSFSRLYHLQFLLLRFNDINRVPKGMSNLVNYRGILSGNTSDYITIFHSMTPMVGKLTSLQTLKEYHIKKNSRQHGIEQLKSLQKLHGSLAIKGLENVKDKAQATLALLNKKRYLEKLSLEWDNSSRVGQDEDVIEGLEPHPNLKGLEICGYEGVRLPSWYMLNHYNLQTLKLQDCHSLTATGLPPNLKELTVSGCHKLKQLTSFPCTLQTLELKDCPNLTGVPYLPHRLERLQICACPKLMQLSPFPCSLEKVKSEDCPGIEALLSSITTNVSDDCGDENNSLQPFSLESLEIVNCSALDGKTLSASLQKFGSLSLLYLWRLRSMTSLLLGPNLTALEYLDIEDLPELTSMGNLQLLTSLKYLTVYKCPCSQQEWEVEQK